MFSCSQGDSLSLVNLAIYGIVLHRTQQYLLQTCLHCSFCLHTLNQTPVGNRAVTQQHFVASSDESLSSQVGRRIVPVCRPSTATFDLLISGPSHPGGDLGQLR